MLGTFADLMLELRGASNETKLLELATLMKHVMDIGNVARNPCDTLQHTAESESHEIAPAAVPPD